MSQCARSSAEEQRTSNPQVPGSNPGGRVDYWYLDGTADRRDDLRWFQAFDDMELEVFLALGARGEVCEIERS